MRPLTTPRLDLNARRALDGIHALRREVAIYFCALQRREGGLKRSSQVRAIQGSNSIKGYTVSEQDAEAAVDDEEPLAADELTWREICGYRRVLTYVLQIASALRPSAAVLQAMHFMLLEYDLAKSPGRYRTSDVYVQDDDGRTVYQGPDSDQVPELMEDLVVSHPADRDVDPIVRASMAHLNLVMIHPFRDGNGRMARVLQTLVLAQDAVLEPTFSSIEEWLGANTADYYAVLAATGRGSWDPHDDAHRWLKFCLRAHHMQAQTIQRRFDEALWLWVELDRVVEEERLPKRVTDALFDAARGLRVQRSTYLKRVELEQRTATRDLSSLVDAGLLRAVGQTRGRYYLAGEPLAAMYRRVRSARPPLEDPYPTLMTEVRRAMV